MNDTNHCTADRDAPADQNLVKCHACSKDMDYLTSLVSENPADSIFICFESIKQKIFVYGKYTGGKYGAIYYSKYYTKEECAEKECENDIRKKLATLGKEEYSRLISCARGTMDAVLLTRDIIDDRKRDLLAGGMEAHFREPNSEKKYFCDEDARNSDYTCVCGEALVKVGSEQHRDLTGMADQKFMETYLPEILSQ